VNACWRPGDAVVLRHAHDDYRWAAPMRVVEDRGDFVALYLQPGSTIVRMGDRDGNPTRDFLHSKRRIEQMWGINHALHLMRAGDDYAVQLYWDEHTWDFRCWYINFQLAFERSRLGFESMDLTLDLVIAPDLRTWEWKDEDEFAQAIEIGWYTGEQLGELKACGEAVLERAKRREPPFDEPWPNWRPDPTWLPLRLPPDWDG
jgi:hypothetical protein